jgi:hypothetical protein
MSAGFITGVAAASILSDNDHEQKDYVCKQYVNSAKETITECRYIEKPWTKGEQICIYTVIGVVLLIVIALIWAEYDKQHDDKWSK